MSITFHPQPDLLLKFASGNLDPAYCSIIEVHNSFCSGCANMIEQFEQLGGTHLEESMPMSMQTSFSEMMQKLDEQNNQYAATEETQTQSSSKKLSSVKDILSFAKRPSIQKSRWIPITKRISDIRVDITDPGYTARLIQLKAGTRVPMHTHQGEEVTVVLKGAFRDDLGLYKAGDFIIRNSSHKHMPYAESDCICFAITNAPLHYTGFLGPVINWFNARFDKKHYAQH